MTPTTPTPPSTGKAATMTPKPPTPQGISALLKRAGYDRSVSRSFRSGGSTSGFRVGKDHRRDNAVEVTHHFWSMGAKSEQYAVKLAEYAKVITDAGWTVETGEYELVVTTWKAGQ